jgi:hypothetical protein
MKTAEEWAKEAKCDKFHHGECECFDRMGSKLQGSCDEIADIVRAAQRDAIEAASIGSPLPFAQSAPRE